MNVKRYRDAAIVIVALAVPFWFLRYSIPKDPRTLSGPEKLILRAITPIQFAAATLARGLSSIWTDYIYLVDVKEDNTRLGAENARLRERVRELEQLEEENRRLRKQLGLKNELKVDLVSAQVVSKDANEFFRVAHVVVDSATREIPNNAMLPVITHEGVVGTTSKAAGATVEVQLVVDADSGVDVLVQRSGARGILTGTGDPNRYLCKVQYVKRTDEVLVGDLFVTSGVGRRFPKGLPVARVVSVDRREFGLYQTVRAEPTVDFSRLEEVLIVVNAPEVGVSTPEPSSSAPRPPVVP